MSRWVGWLVAVGVLAVAAPAFGELDGLALDLHAGQTPEPRWDNLEGHPYVRGNARLRFDADSGQHHLLLAPGDTATLALPAGSDLMLVAQGRPDGFDGLTVWRTTDGAGWRQLTLERPRAERRRYRAPDGGAYRVRLEAPDDHAVSLAAFRSRRVDVPAHPLYRRDMTPRAQSRLRIGDDSRRFRRLNAGEALSVTISGPTRLALEHRRLASGPRADLGTPYSLSVRRDGALQRRIPGLTRGQRAHVARLNGQPVAVGTTEVAYIDVPSGEHEIAIEPDAAVLMRVRRLDDDAALVSGPANRQDDPAALYERMGRSSAGRLDNAAALQRALVERLRQPTTQGGGLAGAARLEARAEGSPFPQAIERAARTMRGAHSIWRTLAPEGPVREAGSAYVDTADLAGPRRPDRESPVMVTSEMADLAGARRREAFVAIGEDAPRRFTAAVPARGAPSRLRLHVASGRLEAPVAFALRVGDRTHRIRVTPQRKGRRDAETGLAALRLLEPESAHQGGPDAGARQRPRAPSRTAGTLSGRFAALAPSAPMVTTARVTVDLPPGVKRVQLAHRSGPRARVAMSYRAAKGFALDETAHRQAVEAAGGRVQVRRRFAERLFASLGGDELRDPATRVRQRLAAHQSALLELLAARHAGYAASIDARGDRFEAPTRAEAEPLVAERRMRRARAHEEAGHWGAAARDWGEAARMARGDAWRRAELARVRALARSGGAGLAERLLRGCHLFCDDAALRGAVFDRLRQRLGERQSNALLIGAHVAQARRDNDLAALAPVVELLLQAGEGDRARDLAALLPSGALPAAQRSRAYHAGDWPDHRDAAINAMPARQRGHWRAVTAFPPSRRDGASTRQNGSGDNDAWSAAIATGHELARRLRNPRTAPPYAEWLAWESSHPGERAWRNADDLVRSSAGRATLRALRRDSIVTAAVATPGEPVEIVAPAGRLRLTLRLKLQGDQREQVGWARVQAGGSERRISVSATGPSAGLVPMAGAYGVGTGRRKILDLEGTSGVITVSVDRPMLVRIERAVATPRLPLVPAALPAVMAAVGRDRSAGGDRCRARVAVARAQPDGVRMTCGTGAGLTHAASDPLDRGDLRLADAPSRAERLAAALAACEAPYGDCAETARGIYSADLLGDDPDSVSELRSRIGDYFGFERVEQVLASAGVRTVAVEGWQPHSPALRARRPFLGDLAPTAEVLSGPGSLYIDAVNRAPTTLLLDLRTVDMPTYPTEPARVRYRLDSGRWHSAEVTPDGRRVAIDVGAGRHAVELTMADPSRARYLIVEPRERRQGRVTAVGEPLQRSYTVATDAEPAVFAVHDTALVRIDRYGEQGITSAYRRLEPGEDSVRVTPAPGEGQALVRVYELRHRGDVPTSAPRYHPDRPGPPSEPVWQTSAAARDPVPVGERVLHGQEDGTTTVGTGWHRRRQAEDEPDQGGERDRFVELHAEHRYRDEVRERYYEASLVARSRANGGPTYGVAGALALPDRVLGRADWLPLDITFDISGFVQDTKTDGPEAAVTARAAARHRRRVGQRTWVSARVDGFVRGLTLEQGLAGDETADRDVFTLYKKDHPVGWGLRTGVTHHPFLDTRIYASVAARSNPKLWDADQVGAQLGARQFIEGIRLDAAYRVTRFLADDDRSAGISTRRVDLDAAYEIWQDSGDRLELTVGLRQDLRSSDTSLGIALDWHFGGGQRVGPVALGNGRVLRDFRPATTSFRSLREARSADWQADTE